MENMRSAPGRSLNSPFSILNSVTLEPSTRFELVTPSLPRTCSTPELRGHYSLRPIRGHLLRCRLSNPLDVAPLRLAASPPSASHLTSSRTKLRSLKNPE